MLCLAALTSCGGGSNEVVPPPVVPPPPGPVVSGLDSRPSNTSCLAGDAPTDSTALAVERVFANLTFSVPVLMLQEPASTERWYVVQKTGLVYAFNNQADVSTRRVFIDLSGQIAVNPSSANDERGLLGMAFHPGYPGNPRVYLSYDANNGSQLVTRVVEYQTQDGGQTLAPSSARVVLQVYQPAANHNGGNIVFGPDGFLYIGRGDGGGGGDQHGDIGNGQRLSTLLGKLLRIDVNGSTGGAPYGIPADNPMQATRCATTMLVRSRRTAPRSTPTALAIPWRWSFDRGSGELWMGDVGQGEWEEVNRVTRGGNYGWRCREGAHAFNASCGVNAGSSIDPVAEYSHAQGSFDHWRFRSTGARTFRRWQAATCLATSARAASGMWHATRRRRCR